MKTAAHTTTPTFFKILFSSTTFLIQVICSFFIFLQVHLPASESFPVAYKGRFLPVESYSSHYIYDLTNQVPKSNEAALKTLWQLHFFGAEELNETPFFGIQHSETKKILNLGNSKNRYSAKTLRLAFEEPSTNLSAVKLLLKKHYDKAYNSPENRSGRTTLELKSLSPDLWIQWKERALTVLAAPQSFPWQYLTPGMSIDSDIPLPFNTTKDALVVEEIEKVLSEMLQFEKIGNDSANDANDNFEKAYRQLQNSHLTPKEIALSLQQQHSLELRLDKSGDLFRALPGKFQAGKWYSLKALHTKYYNANRGQLELTQNFSLYPDALFKAIRESYFELEKATLANPSVPDEKIANLHYQLATLLMEGYQGIAQKKYGFAIENELTYPSLGQLHAEQIYTRYPLTILCIFGYATALIFFWMSIYYKRNVLFSAAFFILIITFGLHTLLLGLRCYILGRPPVTNMLETMLYVPWVSVIISLILRLFSPSPFPLIASSAASLILLVLLQLNFFPTGLENVQAVLNSQYWLLIHVLMVVGSYGLFLLSSILGHIYLGGVAYYKRETSSLALVAQSLLLCLYIGVVLLIGGTLLGGVWAAQSWGRFWDWDPKESWAFISICIYLLWIHAYRFGKIRHLGMAVGSILGFLAISFTWYGVNYILGTGLHSYGFGSGGNFYYYCYLFVELLFLAASVHMFRSDIIKNLDKKTPTC